MTGVFISVPHVLGASYSYDFPVIGLICTVATICSHMTEMLHATLWAFFAPDDPGEQDANVVIKWN